MADEQSPLLAHPWELADWIGEPITGDADERRAEMCLRMASALVRSEVGQSLTDSPPPEAAVMVTLYCASRIYENRENLRQESIDDWSGERVIAEAGAYLTASERSLLAPLRGERRFGGLGVVATTRGETPAATGWVPTDTPGVKFPWYGPEPW